jgi:hypothetical protein
MVMEYGMSDRLGPLQYGKPAGEVFLGRDYTSGQDYSDEVAASIDDEVRALISAAHEEARQILHAHSDAMERMVERLLEQETVDRDEVAEIFKRRAQVGALVERLAAHPAAEDLGQRPSSPVDRPTGFPVESRRRLSRRRLTTDRSRHEVSVPSTCLGLAYPPGAIPLDRP